MPERRDRIDRAVAALDDLDALLVTNLVNVRYLTGYTGTNGIVVLSRERAVFVTDFRYADGVEHLRTLLDVVILER
ncbi:MAG: aminopeptidase P family N-terminal domain-containing protein, partial [Gaiellales bacterium]|nr:aminopeptidase P family N-terminal domain-containing protein [Gaiellales bacterium]